MTAFVALLRAVNIGGRKLLMRDLKRVAGELGLADARTFIASGNLLFTSDESETALERLIEHRIEAHMGASVAVTIRTAAEMAGVAAANPFAHTPGNRVAVIFLNSAPPANAIETARNIADERIALGEREVYVAYGEAGMGRSRLRIPAVQSGTARNMNTVAKLAELLKGKT